MPNQKTIPRSIGTSRLKDVLNGQLSGQRQSALVIDRNGAGWGMADVNMTRRKARFTASAICSVALAGFATLVAAASPPSSEIPQAPIEVRILEPTSPDSPGAKWFTLLGQIAWPLVALAGLVALRKPLGGFLDTVAKRATEISIAGLGGIKLPTLSEASLGEDALTFRTADALTLMNDSAKRTLFTLFQRQDRFEYIAINLGRGDQWLSSRLYIFTTMLQRMMGLRCVVFLAAGPDTESRFLGASTPERIRWSLARLEPWLETAYTQALSCALAPVLDDHGKLDSTLAEQVVSGYLNNITMPPGSAAPVDSEWVQLPPNQQWEHAVWLAPEWLDSFLGSVLWKDQIVASEVKNEARALLRCSAPYVAKTHKNGEFIALVDRVAFLDEFATKVADKVRSDS